MRSSLSRPLMFGLACSWPYAFLSALLAVSLLSTGCTSAKYKKVSTKKPAPGPAMINAPLGEEPIKATLNTVIVYKGPGSWKQEAFWDEYAITLRNESATAITIDRATLLDFAGAGHDAGVNPWVVESQSKSLERKYADAGIAFVRYAGPVAALGLVSVGSAYAAAAASFSYAGAAGGTAAATTASATVVLIPVYLVTVISINHSRKHAIEREFDHRRLPLPFTLSPGQKCSGSLFFPMVPSPQALTLGWRKKDSSGTMRATLPMLSSLHINSPKKSRQATSAPATASALGASSP